MDKTLYIYRASAGSGKTFTLAVEYIKLLIANPTAYKHTLAVTFTNKATAEMKERILSQLYGIAHSLNSSQQYYEKIKKAYPDIDESELRQRAGKALHLILHDYGHFRLQTIDSFFQSILRGLAKELELSGNIEITIDNTQLLENTVDLLIKSLSPTSAEMAWIVEYIEEHLEDGKSWRVHKAIKSFAENILKEEYQERGDKLREQIECDNGALLADYRRTIKKIENDITEQIKSIGKRFFEIANANSLDANSFAGKSTGIWSHFTKLSKGTLADITEKGTAQKCIDNPSKVSNELSAEECMEIANLLQQSKAMLSKEQKILNSCKLSLTRFHQLRLLNSIAKKLREENNRENRFLLEQTTYLLSKMIDNDTSFIFEKIGTEINNIFIDEFQDTSKLQWSCFKVLLHEVMSRGSFNLIVGDVKQSIYRWRNSDWNILNNIEKEFPQSYMQNYNNSDQNTTNYRSERNIVEFNNALFGAAKNVIVASYKEQLGTRLKDLEKAYNDVVQQIPTDKEQSGYAEVRIIEKGENNINDEILKNLAVTLRRLIEEENVQPKDITILIRSRNVISQIVETFNKELPEYGIISDEAYKLSSSHALNIIIAAMRYIVHADDRLNTIDLATRYNSYILKNDIPTDELLDTTKPYERFLPQEFVKQTARLKEMPVNEVIEELITLFNIHTIEDEEQYLYSFLDHTAQYISSNGSNMNDYLDAWNEELGNKCIPSAEDNCVKIVTIHKSKGLEFHTVITPFCTWNISGGNDKFVWCNPKESPFDELSLLPISVSKAMSDSIYSEEYNHEHLFQLVDNLNLLYVACTRASHNLFIFTDAKGNKNTMSKIVNSAVEQMPLDGAYAHSNLLTYGKIMPSTHRSKQEKENPFTKTPTPQGQAFVSYKNSMTSRQSHNLTRFLAQSTQEIKENEYMDIGELMHEIMSHLTTGKELSQELDKKQMEGLIASDKEKASIKKLIEKALSNPQAQEWFSGKYELFNERSILYKRNERHHVFRPDRVMVSTDETIVVDFKFAKPLPTHTQQVKDYISCLSLMGYRNIKGYLWYVYKNNIVEVK